MFSCHEMIESGICRSDCCGPVEMNRTIFNQNRKHQQVGLKRLIKIDRYKVVAITGDGKCIFLNRATHRCMIYDKRPAICRNYSIIKGLPCPYIKSDGTERTAEETRIMQGVIDHTVDSTIDRIKNLVD